MHTRETHDVLHAFGAMVRQSAPGAYTIGEVTFDNATLLTYYPDQLDAYFAFDASDALLGAVNNRSAAKLFAPFLQLQQALPATRWSPFQRNHDQTRTMTALGKDPARARVAASLLLTLPGLPFVYYGEELGMTGDKPDPRLRTPMQWSRGHAAGFTTGNVWEPLQSDSLTANVAAQDGDPSSLLTLYRRLIHLRASNSALARGVLIPAQASSDSVAAFIRRSNAQRVLVVTNLAATPIANVAIALPARALAAGHYTLTDLLDGTHANALDVGADGAASGYVALPTLAPMRSYVLELRGGPR